MRDAGLPIALLLLGIAWLLDSLHLLPDIQWVWVIGLCGAGVAILLLEGVTKSSVVTGPLLIIAGILSFFHQFHGLGWRYVIPVMLIATGAVLLISRSSTLPASRAEKQQRKQQSESTYKE
ncbi:MAG: hypothetical protein V4695_09770 [Pseudomonadota bacterium]